MGCNLWYDIDLYSVSVNAALYVILRYSGLLYILFSFKIVSKDFIDNAAIGSGSIGLVPRRWLAITWIKFYHAS